MRGTFACCTLAALLLAVAQADHHIHHGQEGNMSCHALAPHNADFAFTIYRHLNARADSKKNIFFSPVGITTAMSMLSVGARGNTHGQLISSLGYSSLTTAQMNAAYKHLLHMLTRSQAEQQLDVGNSVAVRTGFNPLQGFLTEIETHYNGEVFNVDFSDPSEAVAQLNRHISTKTNDKIKDLVKDLDSAMAMVLINYVYFRGQWEKPFNKNVTAKGEFTLEDGTKVEVDMMKKTGRFEFFEDSSNHVTVVMLPYKNNTSMMIVLPDEDKMKEVEAKINKDYIKQWHDSLYKSNVQLFMPKFSISADAALEEILKEIGITDAFGDSADFSGISEEIKLKVSKVSHKAVLSVDETGTEAAAVTTLEIMPMSSPTPVKLNRPFLIFIMEHSTKSFLFMGKINNPTAQ